ncbi:uncharacterized protein TNCV_4574101 [Trichonephila clavipes]|nr:uncharacterized protein TNCV_4574101 [Trichonephila clavipes]
MESNKLYLEKWSKLTICDVAKLFSFHSQTILGPLKCEVVGGRRRSRRLTPPLARETFAVEFLACMEVDNEWPWKIMWSDEAHFHLKGYVNTQNRRIWATENPLETQPVPLSPAKVTVWCGFTASLS